MEVPVAEPELLGSRPNGNRIRPLSDGKPCEDGPDLADSRTLRRAESGASGDLAPP